MKKEWIYKTESVLCRDALRLEEIHLNGLGREGWEVCTHEYSRWSSRKTYVFRKDRNDKKEWEYKFDVVTITDDRHLEYYLDQLGCAEWQVVAHRHYAFSNIRTYIFMRERAKTL